MKILIYGAGVIGSIFAYKLKDGGNDVTVLARGKRLEQLKKHGIIIEDRIINKRFQTDIRVTDKLEPEDYYDLILIVMQRQQITGILPILQRNKKVPAFIFMGNNVTGAEEYLKFLESQRILLGFGGTGGYRKDNYIVTAYIDYCTLYVGELDGLMSDRIESIRSTFNKSEIRVVTPGNIDAWLKTHAALISPLAMAAYAVRSKGRRLGEEDEMLIKSIKAFKENLDALIELKIPILPGKYRIMKMMPAFFFTKKLKNLMNSEAGDILLSGHADHAKDEMIRIMKDFRKLVQGVKTDMSNNEHLFKENLE